MFSQPWTAANRAQAALIAAGIITGVAGVASGRGLLTLAAGVLGLVLGAVGGIAWDRRIRERQAHAPWTRPHHPVRR